MTDQTIYFLLGGIGWASLVLGKFFDRDNGAWPWVKEYAGFVILSALAVAGALLIGPGDGVALGSNGARLLAFTLAATSGEAIWRAFTARKAAANRRASRAARMG